MGQAHDPVPASSGRAGVVVAGADRVEQQVGAPGQASVHFDHRRFALRLGWLVETSQASPAQDRRGEGPFLEEREPQLQQLAGAHRRCSVSKVLSFDAARQGSPGRDRQRYDQGLINHIGRRTIVPSAIAREIWHTALQYGIHLVAVHRPGKLNEKADRLSRWKRHSASLKLDPTQNRFRNRNLQK